jgi:hypothetical protein
MQLTLELESAWFQPLTLSSEKLVSKFAAFQMQLVPLQSGSLGGGGGAAAGDGKDSLRRLFNLPPDELLIEVGLYTLHAGARQLRPIA